MYPRILLVVFVSCNRRGASYAPLFSSSLHRFAIMSLICFYCTIIGAFAQSSVGNGSTIAPAAGQQGNYGINATTQSRVEYPTRHFRRHDNTGIGSSFIGTTSPTSEGSPALRPTSTANAPKSAMQFHLPKLESIFPEANANPALESFSPALPRNPELSPFTSPLMSRTTSSNDLSSPDLDPLPSFSRNPSMTNKMQLDSFDSFDKSNYENSRSY